MGFFKALSFLTVLKTGSGKVCDDKEFAGWGRYFFLVGLLIGAMAAGIDYALLSRFSTLTKSAVCVLFIAVITGGLHLDGIIDTFDAAFSMKPVKDKLAIMKKSDIGAFGVIAVVFVIILKVVLLAEIRAADRFNAILIFPAISRACLPVPAYLYDYPREKGKGAGFVKYMTPSILLFGLSVSAVVMYLIMQVKGIIILLSAALFSGLAAYFFSRRFNGITGDVLGAVNELTEVFVLFLVILI
jgi:adenosylcobinamide-GDP ribazoletransferase